MERGKIDHLLQRLEAVSIELELAPDEIDRLERKIVSEIKSIKRKRRHDEQRAAQKES